MSLTFVTLLRMPQYLKDSYPYFALQIPNFAYAAHSSHLDAPACGAEVPAGHGLQ